MNVGLSPNQVKQIYRYLTGSNIDIITYDQIINANTLEPYFKNYHSFIIFYPAVKDGNNVLGHYCSLSKINNVIYFYDPLGYKPDEYKKFSDRKLYIEQVNSLISHFINSKMKIDYSNYKHQSRHPSVATCGRHSIIRCIFTGSNDKYNKLIRRISGIKTRLLDDFIYKITLL